MGLKKQYFTSKVPSKVHQDDTFGHLNQPVKFQGASTLRSCFFKKFQSEKWLLLVVPHRNLISISLKQDVKQL